MLAYGLESYTFQGWSSTADRDNLLDNNAQATNLLSQKLMCMASKADLDEPGPSRVTSLAASAGSIVHCSPVCSPCHSHSRTPTKGEERSRSQSNSMSSIFSQGSQPQLVAASNPAEDGGDSSVSQDDSESDG